MYRGSQAAEVEDVAGQRCRIAERVDVGHHVVAQSALIFGSAGKVDIVEVGTHLGELFGPDARRHAVFSS